ncbi:hypothetical protein AGOR_G00054930 [Albula goreensis]|uniref:Cytoskeleton-associated protein 2 C-terminal domain-containing protein n=1 Tax=Albula goreensis TaxID=1534307 RepID=A0A8T3DV04_9TELE|nr:hypothetical protein AGOR_G00054930 [Albula goreensis]
MEEDNIVRKPSGQELRKQKLMEYLAAKGKLKPPNPKPYLREDSIKPKKLGGILMKTGNEKENQGTDFPRLKQAEKKLQPSAGVARVPLQAARQLCAVSSQNNEHHAETTLLPPKTTQVKPQSQNGAPCQVAAKRDPGVTVQVKTCSKTVVSARNSSSVAITKKPTQGIGCQNRQRLPLAKAGSVTIAQTRTQTSTNNPQTRKCATTTVRARAHPSTAAQTATHSNSTGTAHPNTSAQNITHCNTAAPVRTCPNTRTHSNACNYTTATAGNSKAGLNKTSSIRSRPSIPAPISKISTKPCKRDCKSNLGSAEIKPQCILLRKKAGVQTEKSGYVLNSNGSEPMKKTKQGQSVNGKLKACLDNPQFKTRGSRAQPSDMVKQAPQHQRPDLKVAVSQPSKACSNSRVTASTTGGAGEGQQTTALHRAVRQTMTELRRRGGRWAQTETGTVQGSPTLASSCKVAFKELPPEKVVHDTPDRISMVPSTVPRTARQPCGAWEPAELKTPVRAGRTGPGTTGTAPPQGKKRLTAAQEERLRKLQEWRKAKGISYKRPPMPTRQRVRRTIAVPEHYWTAMEEEEEAQGLVYNIDQSLADCVKLLQEGCPTEKVKEVLSRVPMAKKFAKYWICQVRLMEREGNFEVLPMFEEAVRLVMEPVDDLRAVVFEILKKKGESSPEAFEEGDDEENGRGEDKTQNATTVDPLTPRATSAIIRGMKEGSSVVKYKITATPGRRGSQQPEPMTLDGQELRFFTPVRRSVRIERSASRYPAALQEHDPCVASFRDLLAEEEGEQHGPGLQLLPTLRLQGKRGSEWPRPASDCVDLRATGCKRPNKSWSRRPAIETKLSSGSRTGREQAAMAPRKKRVFLKASDERTAIIDTEWMQDGNGHNKHIFLRTIRNEDKNNYVILHTVKEVNGSVHMAFCFRNNSELYYPFVRDKGIKLEMVKKEKTSFKTKYLFKWGERHGSCKSLQSVARPKMYLSVDNNQMLTIDTQKKFTFKLQ